jgi:heterodisulfide reductase subunit C
MALAHLGQEEMLLEADSPWVCASCHMCTVRCPRGIDIARVMEALRQVILRTNVNHVELCQLAPEDIKDAPTIAMVAGFRKMTS